MIYKSIRIEEEMEKIDPGLRKILYHLDSIAQNMYFGKGIIITSMIRTKEENNNLGTDKNGNIIKGHPESKHLIGQAADIGWWMFEDFPEEFTYLMNTVKWDPEIAYLRAYIAVHEGMAKHIHIQVNKPTLIKHKIGGNDGTFQSKQ